MYPVRLVGPLWGAAQDIIKFPHTLRQPYVVSLSNKSPYRLVNELYLLKCISSSCLLLVLIIVDQSNRIRKAPVSLKPTMTCLDTRLSSTHSLLTIPFCEHLPPSLSVHIVLIILCPTPMLLSQCNSPSSSSPPHVGL